MKRALLPVLMAMSLLGVGAMAQAADNTITVNVVNNAGETISRSTTYDFCQPNGACSMPFSINNGATGVVENETSASTYARSVSARYGYSDNFVEKSCQLEARAYGPSSTWPGPGCEPNSFSLVWQKRDGTGTSPTCTIVSQNEDDPNCSYTVTVRIEN